jgi:hypothetical protein
MRCRSTLLLAAWAASLTAVATAPARPPTEPDVDWDASDRREHDRDQRATVRDSVHGWTWAAMPAIGFGDDYPHRSYRDENKTRRSFVRVNAGIKHGAIAIERAAVADDGHVFLLEVTRAGVVGSLRAFPAKRRGELGAALISVSLAASAPGLWLGGAMALETSGAWLQAVRW